MIIVVLKKIWNIGAKVRANSDIQKGRVTLHEARKSKDNKNKVPIKINKIKERL